MTDQFAGRHGNLAMYHFHWLNLAASATNTDGLLENVTAITLAVMPASGSIVGMSVVGTAAVTAGTGIFTPHLASTEFTDQSIPQVTLSTTTPNNGYDTARPGAVTFVAGATLGISVTTDAAFLPDGSAEFIATLFVKFDSEQ